MDKSYSLFSILYLLRADLSSGPTCSGPHMLNNFFTDGQVLGMSRWPILHIKRVRQGENPSHEKVVYQLQSEKLTQLWVNLPQISQGDHPQLLPSKSTDSDALSKDKNCVRLRGLLPATAAIGRTRDTAVPP